MVHLWRFMLFSALMAPLPARYLPERSASRCPRLQHLSVRERSADATTTYEVGVCVLAVFSSPNRAIAWILFDANTEGSLDRSDPGARGKYRHLRTARSPDLKACPAHLGRCLCRYIWKINYRLRTILPRSISESVAQSLQQQRLPVEKDKC
jgi:hypothetical protein